MNYKFKITDIHVTSSDDYRSSWNNQDSSAKLRQGADFLSRVNFELDNQIPLGSKVIKDFLESPMTYVADQFVKIDQEIPELSLCDNPKQLFEFGLDQRRKYLEDGNQIRLQYSHCLLCLAIYGFECNDLRGPLPLGLYFELSRKYREYFPNLLKKIRNICMIISLSETVTNEFVEYSDSILQEFQGLLPKSITFNPIDHKHYDSLVNEQYLLHFKEDVDDFKVSLEKSTYDEQAIEVFDQYARHLLSQKPIQINRPSDIDIMTWISDSKTYDSSTGSSIVNRTLHRKDPSTRGSLTSNFRFKRTVVNVSPANVRDTYVCDKDTLFTIKYLSFVLRQILDTIPYSAMTSSPILSLKRKKFLKTESSYIMLDFKKCGLTIPHRPIEILADVLSEIYPNERDIFQCMKGFSGSTLKLVDKELKILRGTGLGNGNEICTLISCVVSHYMEKVHNWKSIIYNDDSVWDFHIMHKKHALDFILTFFKGIGFEPNLRKTFISRFNVFCEEYSAISGRDWSKRQLFFLPMANLLLQSSTANAKRFYFNYRNSLKGTSYDIDRYEFVIRRIYGYEFHEFEFILPCEIGGWKDYNQSNFSCLIDLLRNPRNYLSAWEMNYSNLVIRFAQFLLRSGKTSLEGFFETRIRYSGSKTLHFLDKKKHVKIFDEEETVANHYRINSEEELLRIDEDLMNYRGLHNARPKLKFGLDRKSQFSRIRFFKLFWSLKETVPDSYSGYLDGYLISLIRDSGFARNFRLPRQFYSISSSPLSLTEKLRYITYVSGTGIKYPLQLNTTGSQQIQSNFSSMHRIDAGTDIFYFVKRRFLNDNVIFRSRKTNMIPTKISMKEIPLFWRSYSDNIIASLIDLSTEHRHTIIPLHHFSATEKVFTSRFENLPVYVFGEEIKPYWSIIRKKFSNFQLKTLSGYIFQYGVKTKKEFVRLFEHIQKLSSPVLIRDSKELPPSTLYSKGEFQNVLFGDQSVDDMLEQLSDDIEGSEMNPDDSFFDEKEDETFNLSYEDNDELELEFEDRESRILFDDE